MRKFLLFVVGLIAWIIVAVNLGPLILLGISIWVLYVVFKQFLNSDSTVIKVGWAILGLLILCITVSNIFLIIGIAAAIVLYLIIKNWKNDDKYSGQEIIDADDPFTNFERQWSELNS